MLDRRALQTDAPDDTDARARIAVLEDDDALREEILVPGLIAHGYEVEGFALAVQFYRRLVTTSFEAIVLDVGLPEEDGLSVARYLRERSPIGIVMLTGRGSAAERLQALGEAADSWLAKPVEVDVVAATIGSLLRRMRMRMREPGTAGDGAPTAHVPRWRLSAEGWRLHAPTDRSVMLSRSERSILERLLAANGEPVSRDEITAALGESSNEFDPHRIEMLVHRLRRKVADQLGQPLPLRSVRGCGYVLVAQDDGSHRT